MAQHLLETLPLNVGSLAVKAPKTVLRHPLEAPIGIVDLEEAVLDLGVEIQQPEIRGDGGAGDAATTGQIALRIGLSGVQQLAEAEGPLDGVGVPEYLP